MPIILASTSPRRHELLQQVAVAHTCVSLNIDERQQPQELALDYIQRMVSQKAQAALGSLPDNINQAVIITADTIGVLANGTVLQKPTDFADACVSVGIISMLLFCRKELEQLGGSNKKKEGEKKETSANKEDKK